MKTEMTKHIDIHYPSNYYNRRNWIEAWDMPLHTHNVYELYYLFEGNIQYNIDGTIYDISTGDMVYIPKGVMHKTTALSLKHDRFVINFEDDEEFKDLFREVEKIFEHRCLAVPLKKRAELERIFLKIKKETELDDEHSKKIIKNCMYEIFVFIIRNLSDLGEEPVKNVPVFVNDIAEYIKANYRHDISLPVIAEKINKNEAYISRKFKETTGQGINEYINIVRIGEAVKLLLCTDYSVTRVASEVGYNDSSYFTMIFKKIMGSTPKRYKKSNLEEKNV